MVRNRWHVRLHGSGGRVVVGNRSLVDLLDVAQNLTFLRGVVLRFGPVLGLALLIRNDLVLVSEDVVMDVVLLGTLGSQHERLGEASHRLARVRQLPGHLDHNALPQGRLRVDLGDLGVTVVEIQLLDLLVDLLLADDGAGLAVRWVQAPVDERRALVVKPAASKKYTIISNYPTTMSFYNMKLVQILVVERLLLQDLKNVVVDSNVIRKM
jgi:hypothetical protein